MILPKAIAPVPVISCKPADRDPDADLGEALTASGVLRGSSTGFLIDR